MRILTPDLIYQNVPAIPPADLADRGIQAALLDLDGTLCHIKNESVSPEISAWLSALPAVGITPVLFSNNKHPDRVLRMSEALHIPLWRHLAGKPFPDGFRWAMDALSLPASRIAVIGDQIYTDVLGANRMGMLSVFVYSMDYSIGYVKLRHILEKPFLHKRA